MRSLDGRIKDPVSLVAQSLHHGMAAVGCRATLRQGFADQAAKQRPGASGKGLAMTIADGRADEGADRTADNAGHV